MTVVTAIIVLSLLVFFHEFGHFLAARALGVTVEVFSIGFGKKLLSITVGKTEYRVSAILLGGYVRMKGQDDANPLTKSGDPDAYDAKKPWQRILISLAGPLANIALAFSLFTAVAMVGMNAYAPTIGGVIEGSPAQKAGLRTGDTIIAIGDTKVRHWNHISALIGESEGEIRLTVERNASVISLVMLPEIADAKNIFGEAEKRKMIGVSQSGEVITLRYGVLESIAEGWRRTVEASTLIFQSIVKLITGVLGLENVASIITIVDLTAKASEMGIAALLTLTAIISVNLGILNLLPIPALDGGHIMFNAYEQTVGRAPSEGALYKMTIAGWGVLGALTLLGVYNDIVRLIG
ncbi:MAG: RIP metalloprotease RseP [Helicobacteraceae bacterium]|jgi:regulator of sigma E protease|nr:RIP metalloprotease RseP [Helicobacteraceae bacterium]